MWVEQQKPLSVQSERLDPLTISRGAVETPPKAENSPDDSPGSLKRRLDYQLKIVAKPNEESLIDQLGLAKGPNLKPTDSKLRTLKETSEKESSSGTELQNN